MTALRQRGEQARYGPNSVAIDSQHVRRFAECLGADPSSVPPTYAAVYALQYAMDQALADGALRIDAARMLHGEQEFTWTAHPRTGETLTSTVELISDETRGTLRFVTLHTDVRGEHGRAVCTSRSVLVVR